MLAILQARMSSSRLPGKVLKPILGEPMMGRQIERLRRAVRLTRILVATSRNAEDDAIEAYCAAIGIETFRGDLSNVLDRFHAALLWAGSPEHFLRLTADCPLTDPEVVDQCIDKHLATGADYTHNSPGGSFPKGLDVEVCRTSVLETAWREAASAYDQEHVTPFINSRPERFKIATVSRHPPRPYRWTVDTPQDFAFATSVYEALYPANPAFTSDDIVAWQALHPDRVMMNEAAA